MPKNKENEVSGKMGRDSPSDICLQCPHFCHAMQLCISLDDYWGDCPLIELLNKENNT